jgi:hypothetical protein
MVGVALTEFILHDRTSGGLLWTRWWTFAYRLFRGYFWLVEELSAYQERVCFVWLIMHLISRIISQIILTSFRDYLNIRTVHSSAKTYSFTLLLPCQPDAVVEMAILCRCRKDGMNAYTCYWVGIISNFHFISGPNVSALEFQFAQFVQRASVPTESARWGEGIGYLLASKFSQLLCLK